MSIFDQLRKLISAQWGVPEDQITPQSYLKDDLNADPLSIADLIASIGEKFKVGIPPEESSHFQTVEDILNFLSDQVTEEVYEGN
jgi:acyl carrier protein